MQIPVAVGTTYALGRVVTEWLKAGKPADLSPFKTVYDDALREAKKNIELFKNDPKKDEPLGDESKNTICDQTIMNGGPLCTRTMM